MSENSGVSLVGNSPAIDLPGVYLLSGFFGAAVLYIAYCFLRRARLGSAKRTIYAGAFRLAAARGDLPALVFLSEQGKGCDVDSEITGFTPLHAAAAQKQAGALLWLCQQGANMSALKDDGWRDTALHYAAAQGCLDCVKVLLAYGAHPSARNFADDTAASLAAKAGFKTLSAMLQRYSDGELELPSKEDFEGKHYRRIEQEWVLQEGAIEPSTDATILQRGFEGAGTQGTRLRGAVAVFRPLAVITQVSFTAYIIWRALRSLRPGLGYIYSMTFWLAEATTYLLSHIFFISMWYQIERPRRDLSEMLPLDKFPKVEVYVVTYSEPVAVVQATVTAALNLTYPGDRLAVCVLDDGRRDEVASMVEDLCKELRYMGRGASLRYAVREKRKGVPHHAKAGNINSTLLKGGHADAEFVLVLDCDMIAHPHFLLRTVGHFFEKRADGEWELKSKAALLQTPQDFWNVDASDPMVHCARFFYGPMLMGRDGIGACPCCGTGVLFRRDILVSIGGQAYGSITEDYNTAMTLLSAGFATMYLNERLSFGLAPDDIAGVFTQRLRWAMGALQILIRDNPLQKPGLTLPQAFLFFEAAAQHFLCIPTIYMAVVPIIFLFTQYAPLEVSQLWEFTVPFGLFYLFNRLTMFWVHRGVEGGNLELWRGSQSWVWMSVNHLKAIFKVYIAEAPLLRRVMEISFVVTAKDADGGSNIREALNYTWPYLLHYIALLAGSIYFIVTAAMGRYTTWQICISISAIMWGLLICLCVWPPVATLFPRVETEHGWRIMWKAFWDTSLFSADEDGQLVRIPHGDEKGDKKEQEATAIEEMHGAHGKLPEEFRAGPASFRPPLEDFDVEASPFDYESAGESSEPDGHGDASPDRCTGVAIQTNYQQGIPSYAFSLVPDELRPKSLITQAKSNIGKVNLPRHTAEALSASTLLTSMILPEPPSQPGTPASVKQARLLSINLREGSIAPAGNANLSRLPPGSLVLSPLSIEAAAKSGIFLPQALSAALPPSSQAGFHGQELTAAMRSPSTLQGTRVQRALSSAARRASFAASLSSPRGQMFDGGAFENRSLIMLKKGASQYAAASLGPDVNSLIVPVVPSNIYEATIAARPNFELSQTPRRNYMFFIVNALLFAGVIAGTVLEIFTRSD